MPLQDLAVGLGSKKQKKEPLSISWFDRFKKNADSSGGNSSSYKNPEGSDTKDSDSVTVPLPSVIFDDDTPDIYDGPEFTFTPEIYTAAQKSANRAALYYTPDEALQEAYDADMAGKGSDEPDQTGGFGVPGITVKDVTDTDAGALSNPQPLYDMADEFANPSITTTELPSADQEASLMDALMEGQPTKGLMSRPSSFVGEGVQTAFSLLDGVKTPAEMETILGNLFPEEDEEGVIDVSPAREAPDQLSLAKIEKAPTKEKVIVEAIKPVAKVDPTILTNPVKWVYDQNLIGLTETNKEGQNAIVEFFKNSLERPETEYRTAADVKTKGGFAVNTTAGAWCATFVDHVLSNLGATRLEKNVEGKTSKYARIGARHYQNIGKGVKLEDTKAGDIAVFKAHVGFVVGKDVGVPTSDKGNAKALQAGLTKAGFSTGGVDGLWGPNSAKALTAYQKANNFTVTGNVTPETFKALTGKEGKATTNVLVLGGNQDNSVNVTSYPASKINHYRRLDSIADLDDKTFKAITLDIRKAGSTR